MKILNKVKELYNQDSSVKEIFRNEERFEEAADYIMTELMDDYDIPETSGGCLKAADMLCDERVGRKYFKNFAQESIGLEEEKECERFTDEFVKVYKKHFREDFEQSFNEGFKKGLESVLKAFGIDSEL